MRILVLQPAARDEHAGIGQRRDHRLVGVALLALVGDDAPALEARRVMREGAVRVDRVGDFRVDAALLQLAAMLHPEVEVLAAVAGRGVHEAGARLLGDVLAGKQRHVEGVAAEPGLAQRMRNHERLEIVGRHVGHALVRLDPRLRHHVGGERIGQHEPVARLRPVPLRRRRHAVEAVGDLRRIGDGAVAGDRPGRRRPDHDRGAAQRARAGGDRELHPHRVGRVVVVLDLRLGERRLLHHRPHDRLRAAIELARHGELHELGGDRRLRGVAHRRIRVLEIAVDADALELGRLHAHPVAREVAAFAAELVDRHRVLVPALGAVFLLDLPLDRQAVAVPARHVIGVVAEHLVRADDHVLQDLVQPRADMDVGVRVGRAVVQDVFLAALRLFPLAAVEVELFPARQDLRLLLRQPGAHGEVGLGQKQRLGVVAAPF